VAHERGSIPYGMPSRAAGRSAFALALSSRPRNAPTPRASESVSSRRATTSARRSWCRGSETGPSPCCRRRWPSDERGRARERASRAETPGTL